MATPWILGASVASCLAAPAAGQDGEVAPSSDDLTELSLEELMNVHVEVTSVARKPQQVSKSAAAVYVVTNEQIRRSGLTTIPEVLRLVPGLDVARLNSNTWAISARGFNGQFSNKLLVLIDGRSVYTPLFSGVYWDVQDLMLEDVDRIEVIRGPGATIWGSNAVNGVINIITKTAQQTTGGLLSLGAGNEERALAGARYGVDLGDGWAVRAFAKWFAHDGQEDSFRTGIEDDWHQGRLGLRADGPLGEQSDLTIQGEAYLGEFDGPVMTSLPVAPFAVVSNIDGLAGGQHLLGRLGHSFTEESELSVQVYYDSYRRDLADIYQQVDTWDLDLDHRFPLGDAQEVIWGLGYRTFRTEFDGSFDVTLSHFSQSHDLVSAFLQDEIALVADELLFTVGSKFEHNDFTGWEVQPSARLAWMPSESTTFWGAVSRAVRTPSIVEDDAFINLQVIPGAPATVVQFIGNGGVNAEELVAYEAGWRTQPSDGLSLDLTAFIHDYDDLTSYEPGAPFFNGAFVVVPNLFDNNFEGRTWGAELASQWRARADWTLHAAYTYLASSFDPDSDSFDASSDAGNEGNYPANQAQLRSLWNVTETIELDAAAFYVDHVASERADPYLRVDLRLGWRPAPRTDVSLLVHGLFHHEQKEFGSTFLVVGSEPQAGAFLRLTQRF